MKVIKVHFLYPIMFDGLIRYVGSYHTNNSVFTDMTIHWIHEISKFKIYYVFFADFFSINLPLKIMKKL